MMIREQWLHLKAEGQGYGWSGNSCLACIRPWGDSLELHAPTKTKANQDEGKAHRTNGSLLFSSDWPWPYYVDQASLKLTVIFLTQVPEC